MSTLFRARVVRTDAEGVFVEIPELGEGNEWGPLETPPVPLAVGDAVIVGSINEVLEDLALVAKLVTVAVAGNQMQAYFYENAIARLNAGITATSGMMTWLDDEQRLEIYTDEAPAGWIEFYGWKNNQLILPDTHKIGFGNGFPTARLDFTSELNWYPILGSNVEGDTQKRWSVDADGQTQWGPGNTLPDTSVRRTGAGQLRVSDHLGVGGDPASTASVTARQATNRVGFYSNNTESGVAHTNAHFHALEAGTDASRLVEGWKVGDTAPRVRMYMDGEINWQSGSGNWIKYLWPDNTSHMMYADFDLTLFGKLIAEDVQIETKSLPRGIVAIGEITASPAAITTTTAVITLPSFTYQSGRVYKACMDIGASLSATTAYADWRIYKNATSTQVGEFYRKGNSVANQAFGHSSSRVFKCVGSVTCQLILGVTATGGSVTPFGFSNSPGQFWVEDIGKVGDFSNTPALTLT